MCPLGDYSLQHCLHWAETQDAQRLGAASPINAQLVRANNHSSSQQPSGDRLNNPTPWEGIDSDFPLSLLISYSYVIADGDLMGVSDDLHHCCWCVCVCVCVCVCGHADWNKRVPHPVRIWQMEVFYISLFQWEI